jgi:TolA-binding protein
MLHMKVKPRIGILCVFLIVLSAGNAVSQSGGQTGLSPQERLQRGVTLYGKGSWAEAATELRRSYSETNEPALKADALYWIAMTELGAGNYENSIKAMDELKRVSTSNIRYTDLPYHRGRACYYLGRYDEAITLFRTYIDGIASDSSSEAARKSAALYWMGECLYALGQLDKAQDVFSLVVEQYPQSVKYEASSYRLALINQKKIEVELLSLLRWTHEESLKTVEEYQRRERAYDQAIVAYQKKIAEMLQDSYLAELESSNAGYRQRLVEAEAQLAEMERMLAEANVSRSSAYTNAAPYSPNGSGSGFYLENSGSYVDSTALNSASASAATSVPDQADRVDNIRQSSIDLIDQLTQILNDR